MRSGGTSKVRYYFMVDKNRVYFRRLNRIDRVWKPVIDYLIRYFAGQPKPVINMNQQELSTLIDLGLVRTDIGSAAMDPGPKWESFVEQYKAVSK